MKFQGGYTYLDKNDVNVGADISDKNNEMYASRYADNGLLCCYFLTSEDAIGAHNTY